MQIIVTDAWLAQSRAIHLSGLKLLLAGLLASVFLVLTSVAIYHGIFLTGVKQGWPVFTALGRMVYQSKIETQDIFMRENLDAMARKLGEMQARMLLLESLSERVAGLAGMNPQDFKVAPGAGGALVAERSLTMEELVAELDRLDLSTHKGVDWLTAVESRLFDQRIQRYMIPTEAPVRDVPIGSPFGFRIDPFTGRPALHTGLDFPADVGTPILAAAGGVVVVQEYHPAYGNMVEVDHGNQLITRYAHASKVVVRKGDIVKRGQKIAEVGSTGRSTGPHLHFEVWVAGVPQNPQRFLSMGDSMASAQRQSAANPRP